MNKKTLTIIIIVLSLIFIITLSQKVSSITGTNDENNINITRGQIDIAPISFSSTFSIRGAAQYIAGSGNDSTGTIETRFGILLANTAPTQPTLSFPTNNSYLGNNTIKFKWIAEDQNNDTLTSLLEVFNNSALTEIYYRNSTIDNNITITINHNLTIPEEITLYWRVLTNDSEFNSSFSDIWQLTTDYTPPTSFNLTFPANNTESTDTTPELAWLTPTETNLKNKKK